MILTVITGLLTIILLELNKNALYSFPVALALLVGYGTLHLKVLMKMGFAVRLVAYLLLVAALGLLVLKTPAAFRAIPAVKGEPKETDVITVKQGKLTGVYSPDGQIEIYTGIPYATAPVGELRWKEPQDPESWQGILKCDSYKPMSMQPRNPQIINSLSSIIGYHEYDFSLESHRQELNSEDALYLNIWKPAGKCEKLPVLVYVHGGSLQTGQPWYPDYSGDGLAREGIIVVNMGYRLGIFGFFADEELIRESDNHTTGNYGLLDQIKALQWVRDNIAAFGGDPDNVTLAGESAGGAAVTALAVSPLAKGLFRRVIAESSTVSAPYPAHSYRQLDEALQRGRKTMEELGVTSIEEMRKLPAEKLVGYANVDHHITVDGYALEMDPYQYYQKGQYNFEAMLHGYNKTEARLFLILSKTTMKNYEQKVRSYFKDHADKVLQLYPAENDQQAADNWQKIYSAVFFSYGHYRQTRNCLDNGIPVYEYYFTKYNKRLGYNHGGEEVYFYGNVPQNDYHYDQSDYDLEKIMVRYFASFIKTGDPNYEGASRWQPQKDAESLFELGDDIGTVSEENIELFRLLDEFYGR
ncbi:MAG: carboxylesterase family protein [Erysipelotrichaceae bacterium]|nr:carboxylesterase family protein [Erysipelotrichaceae bacterium]